MITPMAASLADARPDWNDLHRVDPSGTRWSSQGLTGHITAYIAFNDPAAEFEGGIKEMIVQFRANPGMCLTTALAEEVLRACQTGHDYPTHYVLNADHYDDDFAAAFDAAAGPGATVTLIDRSIMNRWNENNRALKRISLAQHALAPHTLPADVFAYEIDDPDDPESVALHFGHLIYQVCDTVHHFHGELALAEGVASNFAEAPGQYDIEGQRNLAIAALAIAAGAVEGLFPELGIDQDVIDRTLKDLFAAVDVVSPGTVELAGEQR